MALINYVTQVEFGFGSLELLQEKCSAIGIKRPLLVTDKGVVAAGIADRVLSQLKAAQQPAIYDGTIANPNEATVRAAVDTYRAGHCDGIIAVGGGSSIDLAKGVAVCATHSGPLQSFAVIEGGITRITGATAPVIAIPTTAGTGSEVGRGAILILDDGRKVGIISPHLIPKIAICDPELTMKLPSLLTAATGMDAIAHCIETFLAPSFNPPADGIALDGLRRAWAHIERATKTPSDREARLNMMSASMQGAMAFQKGLGCVHSLSHSLGGINPNLHHGTLNAVFLPPVIEFNKDAEVVKAERKMARLAQAMNLSSEAEIPSAIREMNKRLGLVSGLAELGVTADTFPRIVDGALKDHSHLTNPRLATAEDYTAILAASM